MNKNRNEHTTNNKEGDALRANSISYLGRMAIARIRRDMEKPCVRGRRMDHIAWSNCRLADVVVSQSVLNLKGVFSEPQNVGTDVIWVPPEWSLLYLVIGSSRVVDNHAYYILIKEDRSWILDRTMRGNNSLRIVTRSQTNVHLKIGLSRILGGLP